MNQYKLNLRLQPIKGLTHYTGDYCIYACAVTADGKLFSPSGLADEKQKTVSHCSRTRVHRAQTLAGDDAQETIKALNDPWKED